MKLKAEMALWFLSVWHTSFPYPKSVFSKIPCYFQYFWRWKGPPVTIISHANTGIRGNQNLTSRLPKQA